MTIEELIKIIGVAEEQGYGAIKLLKDWNGYKVYDLLIDTSGEIAYIGLPYVILVKGDEIRMSTAEEAFKILHESLSE